ncbi:feruloyl-CoA synthase [Flavilitoribacter nigricans DSM 23189 = NBRC 102662]|uniref:Feruloyl-CoA synthase n=2 Tax=Flavilitoribacter TaxID=2762562 RepID=A0A2D0N0C6_FLAN2|nr:feruloyl-CoA synthase [Flavilitoribacter nigricans DSM 23189 = NBRC 102662]
MKTTKTAAFKEAPFLEIPTQKIDIRKRTTPAGISYLQSSLRLEPHPHRMTARLLHWAEHRPDRVFLGERDEAGQWRTISYRETLERVLSIAQWLLDQGVSPERPVAILAENCIEHALFALAALHIGVPHSTISPAYATKSSDFTKLKHAIEALTPGVIFVSNGSVFERALNAIPHRARVAYITNPPALAMGTDAFAAIATTKVSEAVGRAYENITPNTIAKVLFTSGSTGKPKGVINTHGNITTNWQQIVQVFPFMTEGFELIDWLPWNHTFGGNHNLGLTLYNSGSLYIDNGNPTPEGIKTTIANLRERRPTIYFNVPKGFEELIPYLKTDRTLRERFFSELKLLFYAGAGMAQHVWDTLEELSFQTTGKRLLIATGLGCTESSPSAMFNTQFGSFAGMLGVPVPGLELKLVPVAGKLEARYRGNNIMPGYWRNAEATAAAFDEEGFYKTGDALEFVDPDDPNAGMIFDGRIAEDFKLSTGTWVSVGSLRSSFVQAARGLIQDVVITGHNRDYIGAIVFPEPAYLRSELGITAGSPEDMADNPRLLEALGKVLQDFARQSTGSSRLIRKLIVAPFALSPALGELTDKGSINQNAVLRNRAAFVELLYGADAEIPVLTIKDQARGNKK